MFLAVVLLQDNFRNLGNKGQDFNLYNHLNVVIAIEIILAS